MCLLNNTIVYYPKAIVKFFIVFRWIAQNTNFHFICNSFSNAGNQKVKKWFRNTRIEKPNFEDICEDEKKHKYRAIIIITSNFERNEFNV